ncbi:DUF1345 domain-containing protein [Parafilimonas sp.]|jgi:uncharacterized membrane protein|uniref:DUF1345 domain-containing protein n=1 Tax=Parafilimonas sp. TaxID=1969739 RepID=UPI003F7F2C93
MQSKKEKDSDSYLLRMHPLQRIAISLIVSFVAFFILKKTSSLIKITLMWDAFALCYLILSWIVIAKRSVPQIKKLATKDDGSAIFVFILIVISSLASMFTVLLLMLSQQNSSETDILYLPAAISGMMLSWIMVHSIYTFHYAHRYYDDDENNPGKDATGLEFPGNAKPNYLDFAYFSFVIGCTFQVSDVEVSSPKIRRIVLFHGLLSFALNTFVVALTINLIAGLSK